MKEIIGLLVIASLGGGLYTYIDSEKEDKVIVDFKLASGFAAQQMQIYDAQIEAKKNTKARSSDEEEIKELEEDIKWLREQKRELQKQESE